MKKTIILSLAVFLTAIFNPSSAKNPGGPFINDEPDRITTLIINANVTVMLVNNHHTTLEVDGGKSPSKLVSLKKIGDTLVIDGNKNRYLQDAVIVYVPANQLKNIQINSEAHVRSLYILQIAKLAVTINGACELAISNIGEVNLIESDNFNFEHSTHVRRIPKNFIVTKKF
jgi:hypothetical protein